MGTLPTWKKKLLAIKHLSKIKKNVKTYKEMAGPVMEKVVNQIANLPDEEQFGYVSYICLELIAGFELKKDRTILLDIVTSSVKKLD